MLTALMPGVCRRWDCRGSDAPVRLKFSQRVSRVQCAPSYKIGLLTPEQRAAWRTAANPV
jgi:hypothetical protein